MADFASRQSIRLIRTAGIIVGIALGVVLATVLAHDHSRRTAAARSQGFALAHGVTITALVDAIGRYLAIMDASTDRPVGPALASIVDTARTLAGLTNPHTSGGSPGAATLAGLREARKRGMSAPEAGPIA